jgi:squalene-hopene/tetraprenyl-beta-curcumene cyclase
MRHTVFGPVLLTALTCLATAQPRTFAQTPPAQSRPAVTQPAATLPAASMPVAPALRAKAHAAMQRGFKYLESVQSPDGAWQAQGKPDPAVTAVVAQAFAQDPDYGPNHAVVRKALAFIMFYRQKDGGIYVPGAMLENYQTSVALMFLSTQPPGHKDTDAAIRDARQWLKTMQWTESRLGPDDKPVTVANPWYGGAGYGHSKRPDLSNTQMMLEALHQSGLPADDPAYQKAMKFVSRCQMLSSTNDQPFARGADDGGFVYSPASGGESKAGATDDAADRKLRSYGSMTYAAFKSMLHANLSPDDERVRAAWGWIRSHYTLDENPNMPGALSKQGLYYYYQVFAKALEVWGREIVVDSAGNKHHWREDLLKKLISLQREDGSWLNEADRWYEGYPHYVTGLAILSMQSALRK